VTRRLLLLGGAGVFGSRIARLLAGTVDAELVLAGRDPARVAALAAELRRAGATSRPLALEREGGGLDAALDLLLDREAGLWHLASGG
jgi:saccharopine dehydrogenase-like NADP-dependent oxidoreductase